MMGRLTSLTVLGLTVALMSVPASLAAGTHATLIAMPTEGHNGSLLYLSGGGFAPHHRLGIEMNCGGGHTVSIPGPVVSTQGTFVAFRMYAPGFPTSTRMRCTVEATRTARGGGPLPGTTPAKYTLVPTRQALPRCAQQMCVKVTPVLSPTKGGEQGSIVVNAWPGAVAVAVVTYPGGRIKYRNLAVGWRGTTAVKVRIARTLKASTKAYVSVTAALGSMKTTTTARFVVLPTT
jgi:hypothetical protein